MNLSLDTNTGGAEKAGLSPGSPLGEPMAMSRKTSVASVFSIPTPTRDLQTRNGLFASNILRLEQSAEKMSESGSDIGEEIRKMNEAERARSRQNSIQSSNQGELVAGSTIPLEATRSRASSHAHGIVDVNNNARWGGYSPGGWITSPVGSVRSHASMQRKPSVGYGLAQALEPTLEGKPLDSPLAPSSVSVRSGHSMSRQASQASRVSASSFGQRYDQIAEQIHEQLDHVPSAHEQDDPSAMFDFNGFGYGHEERPRSGTVTPPARRRSMDTFQEAEIAFADFDGVHFSPSRDEVVQTDEDGNEVRRVSARTSSGTLTMEARSILRQPRANPDIYAEPPPDEGMVYYPAPVPRMLNLPKRLSQLPSANVQAKRRTLAMGQLDEARLSTPWLRQGSGSDREQSRSPSGNSQPERPGSQQSSHPRGILNERMSMANFHNLPPQLRASMYWDHQSVSQSVDIKSESAVATLDNILAASVTAPVSAFTHHPFAGDVANTYAPERLANTRSTATLITRAANAESPEAEKMVRKRPSSFAGLLNRSSSTDDLAQALKKNGSRSSMLLDFNEGGKKLQKRKSQMSLGTELDHTEQEGPSESHSRVPSGSRLGTMLTSRSKVLDEGDQIKEDFKEEAQQEHVAEDEEEEGEASFVQPSTLLAELQVRKAQQKTRNRTAVTAYPNGMQSTLLQLDAVAEINKRKRQKQRIALAWEDPNLAQQDEDKDGEDEDVPLGVLYPTNNGLINRRLGDERDWNRPLGLMERRELEENEPLASRKSRLLGGPALARPRNRSPHKESSFLPNGSQLHLAGQPDAPPEGQAEEEEDDNEGETLAQRLKRLRTKSVLDATLDFAPKDGSRPVSTWTDDMLSQFGGLDGKDKAAGLDAQSGASKPITPPPGTATPVELENETLGQRRARLQREREASGGANATRPGLRNSVSMADLLTNNPVNASKAPSRKHTPAPGTLLDSHIKQSDRAKRQLMNTNMRSSSYGLNRALVDTRPQTARAPYSSGAGLLGQQTGGFPGGQFNNAFGGMANGMQTSASTPMFGMQNASNYFAAPQMPGYGAAPQFNPAAYNALMGAAPMTPATYGAYGFPAQNMGMAYNGMAMPGNMNMNMGMGMGMGMGMMTEEQMTPQQRANIDRWRLSVAQ